MFRLLAMVYLVAGILLLAPISGGAMEPITPLPQVFDYDREKAVLGKRLFFNTRLSSDGTVFCGTCHDPDSGGAESRSVSTGVYRRNGTINAPTVFNAIFNFRQFWNGRARNLKEQAIGPSHNPREMDMSFRELEELLNRDPGYRADFSRIYGTERVRAEDAVDAIVEFEAALITPNAKIDRYLRGEVALDDDEKAGYLLFKFYLLLLVAIVGGSLFFIAVHRTERLLAAQSETLGRIEEIQRKDQRLDLELTNAAFRLYFDFDQVIEAIGRIGELTGELLELPYLDDGDFALVREGFSAYRTQFAHKEDLALRFGTVNAVVKNSTTRIPSLAHRYLSSAEQIDAAYLKEISDVTSAVFLASNSLDADFAERLGASVERLSAMEHDSADIRALHRIFLAHARALLRWLPAYGSMLDAALSLPTRTTLVAAKERFMAVSNRKAEGRVQPVVRSRYAARGCLKSGSLAADPG